MVFAVGCGLAGGSGTKLPPDPPQDPGVVSLNPQNWYIRYSDDAGEHPVADPAEGAWSIEFPTYDETLGEVGHLNYVETSFAPGSQLPQEVSITYEVRSKSPRFLLFGDKLPATFRLMFEQKNDNMFSADGRWWTQIVYSLGSADNQVYVFKVPLTPDKWSNVYGMYGSQDPARFNAALKNVGFFGLTFGGQDFAGHGVALSSGSAKFILINYDVE
jgi:hypothetical protein